MRLHNKYKFVVGLLMMLTFLVISVGCPAPGRKPARLQKEPTISLYINETREKKNIKLEDYLLGVVAAEMDTSWPTEALAAQAILARTFTMKKIEAGGVKEHGTDASTDEEEFQAYDPAKINDNVRNAVKMTRGKVVTYQGKYINGWFHADGGGRTAASALEGLAYKEEPTPYIKSVKDPGFAITFPENKSWTTQFPLEQVRRAVQEAAGGDPGQITQAQVVKKGPSGRAMQVKIGTVTISAPALRLALGNDKMRSTLLDKFAVENGQLVIAGKGYGHGVGMSQWGARALAEQGKKPEEIVKYFFQGVDIVKKWD